MRFLVSTFVVIAAWVSSSLAGPLTVCTKNEVVHLNEKISGSVIDFTNNHRVDRRFYSPALEQKRDMYVYVPPGYDPKERYPLMIWLHGFNQDEKDFFGSGARF